MILCFHKLEKVSYVIDFHVKFSYLKRSCCGCNYLSICLKKKVPDNPICPNTNKPECQTSGSKQENAL